MNLKGDTLMKSKLLIGTALPAVLALGIFAAAAQEPTPPTSPIEKMPAPSDTMEAPSTAAPPAAEPAPATEPAPTAIDKSDEAGKLKGSYPSEQTASEWRSTKLVGLNVFNSNSEKIGDINDLILDADGKVVSAVIGVGGFLGMGEKLVAVPFSELKFSRDNNGNVLVTLDSTKEALEAAPDFQYYAEKRS